MPTYIDLLLVYGAEEEDREVRYSAFRARTVFVDPDPGNIIPDLNRSGRQHEICYNLKAVAPKEPTENQLVKDRWRIRQAAVYHRLDLATGSALWIIADPREAVKKLIGEILPEGPVPGGFGFDSLSESFDASLDTHLALAHWASDEWRRHLQGLEVTIDDLTRPALLFDDSSLIQPRICPRVVTRVQEYEEKVNEAVMAIESNANIMESLLSSYTALIEDHDFPSAEVAACRKTLKMFSARMGEFIFDLKAQVERGKVLSKIARDRKHIILQQVQMRTAAKQERVAHSMWQCTERGQKEAIIAKRTVAIIALLYLPPTFVSTFISTDVVKYQDGEEIRVYFSQNALNSFLYVTIPLWVIALLIVAIYYKWESWRREKRAQGLLSDDPDIAEYWENYSRGRADTDQTVPRSVVQHLLGKEPKSTS